MGRSAQRLDKSETSALRRLRHADANEKHYISHTGMNIGTHSNGDARFVSSRQIVDGPVRRRRLARAARRHVDPKPEIRQHLLAAPLGRSMAVLTSLLDPGEDSGPVGGERRDALISPSTLG